MDATFDRRELFEWLAAYAAAMDLMAIGVMAGSHRVASCPALGDFQDEYRRAVPAGRAAAGQLAATHRRLVLALRDLRDARGDDAWHAHQLDVARKEHAAVVDAVLGELRPVGVLRTARP